MRQAFLGFLLLIVLSGCSAKEDIAKAEAAIADFHDKMNNADFDSIYTGAGPQMQSASTQVDLVKLLTAIHRKLGAFQSGKTAGWNVNVTTGGEFVTLKYSSTYEQGDADENFVFSVQDGKALLSGYHINSTALILN